MANANGRNSARYVRNNHALRKKLPPICDWCLQPIDLTLHHNDPMAWTSDHVKELQHGGHLYGERVPMHRRCNSQKSRGVARPVPNQWNTEAW